MIDRNINKTNMYVMFKKHSIYVWANIIKKKICFCCTLLLHGNCILPPVESAVLGKVVGRPKAKVCLCGGYGRNGTYSYVLLRGINNFSGR